jgi:hypothetical protein
MGDVVPRCDGGILVEAWRHCKEIILECTICALLTKVIHHSSKVCMPILLNLIKYYADIVVENLDVKGCLQLFLASCNMQPLNPIWI